MSQTKNNNDASVASHTSNATMLLSKVQDVQVSDPSTSSGYCTNDE